jgi:hypothetical protein
VPPTIPDLQQNCFLSHRLCLDHGFLFLSFSFQLSLKILLEFARGSNIFAMSEFRVWFLIIFFPEPKME